VDYRKFLGVKTTQVLPYLGGMSVDTRERRLRVNVETLPGWYAFVIEGRQATIEQTRQDPIEVPDLSALPVAHGHLSASWLFLPGAKVKRVYLLPDEQALPLSPCTARRWYSGHLLFDRLEFEEQIEETVREQLQKRQPLIVDSKKLKGIPATLRAAFAYELLTLIAYEQNVIISPHEVVSDLRNIADIGVEKAQNIIATIVLNREQERQRVSQARQRVLEHRIVRRQYQQNQAREQRIINALDNTGAHMLSIRFIGDGQVETTFDFMGQRFISIIEENTLQVFDAGVCLEGADGKLTLDSLPGVIREAIETEQLYITRHS